MTTYDVFMLTLLIIIAVFVFGFAASVTWLIDYAIKHWKIERR